MNNIDTDNTDVDNTDIDNTDVDSTDVDSTDVDSTDVDSTDIDNTGIQVDVKIDPHVTYIYALITAGGKEVYPEACGDRYNTLEEAKRYYNEAIAELPEPLNTYPVVIVESTTTFKIINDDDFKSI